MRVTESTRRAQVLGNIQKNSEKMQNLQMQMSTGKRLNKASDDPVAVTVAQDIITKVSSGKQRLENLAGNIAWLERSEVELGQMAEILSRAKQLVVSQTGSSSTPDSRNVTAQELEAVERSLFDAANSREGKLFLFGGTKTLNAPLVRNGSLQAAKVEKQGIVRADIRELVDVDQFKAQFEGYSENLYRVKITQTGHWGKAHYKVSDDGGLTWSKEDVLRPQVPLFNPQGKPDDRVVLRFSDEQGLLSNILPDSFDFNKDEAAGFDFNEFGIVFPEGMEFAFTPNPQVTYVGSTDKKEVLVADGITVPIQITAEDILLKAGGEGEIDTFSLFSSLQRALRENDGKALAARLSELELSEKQILKMQAEVGNTMRELQTAQGKIEDKIFDKERRLSEIRDLDMAEATINLTTAEATAKVSMDAGSRLIQPSLSDFLR